MKLNVAKIAHFNGHKNAVFALSPALHSEAFYSGGADGFIVEWDVQSKTNGTLLVQVPRPVYTLCLLAEEQLLLCGTASGNLHIIDLNERKEIRNIEAHQLGIYDIKILSSQILTTGGDGKLNVWNRSDYSLIKSIHQSKKSARVIAIHPQQIELTIGFSDWHLRVFDTNTFSMLHETEAHKNSIFALSYIPDGNTLVSGGRDAMLRHWDKENNFDLLKDIPAHTLHINSIAFNPQGNLFATASMDKTIKIWDAETFTLLKVIDKARNNGHLSSVNKVYWYSENQLITCSDDRTVMMWQID